MTFRSVVIAILLSVVCICWIHQASLTEIEDNPYAPVYLLSVPPVPAVFGLLLLVALVPISARIARKKLSEKELIFVFMFLVISVPPVTFGILEMLVPWMTNTVYFQTPQDNLAQISEALPKWFYPHDSEVIRQMYEGSENGVVPWKAWALPLGVWTIFMTLVFVTGMCLVSLFRKQWVERERLRYPLLFIPISIVNKEAPGSKTSFFKNPLVWAAFVIVFAHHIMNVLHAYNPAIMSLQDRYNIGAIFTERPWTAFRGVSFFHRPQMIGLAYFVSLDVLFSGWFFFILQNLLVVITDVFGLQATPGFPFVQEQGAGAYIGMLIILFWVGRGHLSNVVRKAFYNDPTVDDSGEPMSYRLALFGSVGGFLAIIAWTYTMGFSPIYSIPFFAMLIGFGLVYARVRAEAGVPSMWAFPFNQHHQAIINAFGFRNIIDGNNITNASLLGAFAWLDRGYFTAQMGYHSENEALCDRIDMKSRFLPAVMTGAFVLGCVVAYYLILRDYYDIGALAMHGGTTKGGYNITSSIDIWTVVDGGINNPGPGDPARMWAMLGGGIVTALLVISRQFFMRSPFHPLGFIATLNHGYALWGPFFITWLIKWLIHQLGGAKLFRQLMPFFLGLVMADLLAGGLSWILMAAFGSDILQGYIVHFG